MIMNIYHKINLLQQKNKIVVDPPPQIIEKADTGSTVNYFTQADAHALVDVEQTNMGPRVRLPDNIKMEPDQVGHLHLALPTDSTETHVFPALQNAYLMSVGQLCDDGCKSIFNKNSFKSRIKIKTSF